MFALFSVGVALADGAETPQVLYQEVSTALSGGEPWKIIDYVVPEDRALIAGSFAMMAGLTANGDAATAELQAIGDRYGIKPVGEALTSDEYEVIMRTAYADVTDYHGLSQDLWAFMKAHGGAEGEVVVPKLKGGSSPHPALKIGKQKLPLVLREGRWYIQGEDAS